MSHALNNSLILPLVAMALGICGCQAPGSSRIGGFSAPLETKSSAEKNPSPIGHARVPASGGENPIVPVPAPGPNPLIPIPEDGNLNRGTNENAESPPIVQPENEPRPLEQILSESYPRLSGPNALAPCDVFAIDRQGLFPMLASDAKGLLNWRDMGILGGALGGALALRPDVDGDVREFVREHPKRWGGLTTDLSYVGNVEYQIPVLLGVYGYSLYSSNDELHDLMKAMLERLHDHGRFHVSDQRHRKHRPPQRPI